MGNELGRRIFLTMLAGAPVLATTACTGDQSTSGSESVSATSSVAVIDRSTSAGETDGTTTAVPGVQPIAPASAALLVMDYQPAWIKTLTDTDPLLDRAAKAIAIARERGVRIGYTRVAFTAADYAAVPPGNVIFNVIARPDGALDDDLPATAIDDRVAPAPPDKVIRKTRVSSFARTDLDGWLRGSGIDTLILAGISTSGVVLSTVCDAADLDYRVLVLSDACADRDPDIQQVLTTKIFPQRAQVITVDSLPKLLGGS